MRRPLSQNTFVIQVVSNHGTTNPIVARLTLQTSELLRWVDLADEARDAIFKLFFDLQNRLLRCYDALSRLKANEQRTLEATTATFANGNRTLPFLIGMQDETEIFLAAAKQYLRDLVSPFNALYGANLSEEASVFWDKNDKQKSAAAVWADSTLGKENALGQMLKNDCQWIGDVVKRRNAMEHPGKFSGKLHFENYCQRGPLIVPPCWWREGGGSAGEKTNLMQDLQQLLENLLEFGEDLVAVAVSTKPVHEHITVYEIPTEQRDPKNPARFTIGPDEFLLSKLAETAEPNAAEQVEDINGREQE